MFERFVFIWGYVASRAGAGVVFFPVGRVRDVVGGTTAEGALRAQVRVRLR